MQVHIYIQSVGLAKMAIKRLQGNNREKYNYMYVSRYTCTIILKPHSSSVDKQCYIYIHFCHYLNHTLLSLPIASPSPGTMTSPVLLNVRFLPGQHCGLNNVSRYMNTHAQLEPILTHTAAQFSPNLFRSDSSGLQYMHNMFICKYLTNIFDFYVPKSTELTR